MKLKCFALEKDMIILNAHVSYIAGICLSTTHSEFLFSKQDYYTL